MSAVNYLQLLRLTWPEIILVLTALLVLAADLAWLRKRAHRVRFASVVAIAASGCVAAMLKLLLAPEQGMILDGALIANPLTQLIQIALLALTILTLFLIIDSEFTEHIGEFVVMALLATVGMMFLVATQDLLVLFVSLELLSLSLYVLTGFDKRSSRSAEAALKYFLFGGTSAAFLLFGFSLVYGLANSTSLPRIAEAIGPMPLNPMLLIALVMITVGFGFKVAAAPLHFWAPDVYQGAPAPSAAFIASSSKVAGFVVFFQVLTLGFSGAQGSLALRHPASGWAAMIVIVAVLSMLVGNIAAIAQSSLRRLLAYSAVAHAGYMLLAMNTRSDEGLSALIYYVLTYAFSTLGLFGVIALVERDTGGDTLEHLRGLGRRAPLLAACLAIFVLSLAGIPPLTGFLAKFFLFAAVLAAQPHSSVIVALVVLAIGTSGVSLYYYLRVLKAVYVTEAEATTRMHSPLIGQMVVALLAASTVLLGVAPRPLLAWISSAVTASH